MTPPFVYSFLLKGPIDQGLQAEKLQSRLLTAANGCKER